jgi:ribonuclease III family protein
MMLVQCVDLFTTQLILVIDLGEEENLWPNLPVIGDRVIPVNQLSPVSLAYLGDAVYELYVRTAFLLPLKRSHAYHQEVVSQVRAEAQAQHLQVLLPKLNESELNWLKRGRNAAGGGPRRLNPEIYQQATSLETLIGYLYLTNPLRLQELLAEISLVPAIS